MKKTKTMCFRYKKYYDIYVDNVSFSGDNLLSLLDFFPDQKVVALIESDAVTCPILSSLGVSIKIDAVVCNTPASGVTIICNKKELLCLLKQVNMVDFEGLFVASINVDIVAEEFLHSLKYTANRMVKNAISDIAVSINFPENEITVSLAKTKYTMKSVKDKINSIFGI